VVLGEVAICGDLVASQRFHETIHVKSKLLLDKKSQAMDLTAARSSERHSGRGVGAPDLDGPLEKLEKALRRAVPRKAIAIIIPHMYLLIKLMGGEGGCETGGPREETEDLDDHLQRQGEADLRRVLHLSSPTKECIKIIHNKNKFYK